MPNHCENDLYISGNREKVAEVLALIGADKADPEFDFNKVIPYPEHFAARDRDMKELGREKFLEKYGEDATDGFNSGGYEWRLNHWGTKWGAYDVVRRDYGGVCVSFQTAWSPSPQIVAALHKLFPDVTLSLEYFECGGCFSGGITFIAESDAYDEKWEAGVPSQKWHSDAYRGNRGG